MPEGPEIRRVADRLAAAVADTPLTRVWFARPDLEPQAAALEQSTVTGVRTKGKALLTEFSCGLTVYSHNQLYGRWYFTAAGERPQTRRQLRWLIETEDQAALLYSATDIAVLPTAEVVDHPFVARAGIDVLSERPSVDELAEYLSQPRFARRALGALLLDQSFVAGIGNYLRSEILFRAGLGPGVRLGDLGPSRRIALAKAIIEITERAYLTGGITNDAEFVRRLKAQGWSRGRYRHYVFGRAGESCHFCKTPIEKLTMASRRLYRCPYCQPPRDASAELD